MHAAATPQARWQDPDELATSQGPAPTPKPLLSAARLPQECGHTGVFEATAKHTRGGDDSGERVTEEQAAQQRDKLSWVILVCCCAHRNTNADPAYTQHLMQIIC
jgi:hypothetical protein